MKTIFSGYYRPSHIEFKNLWEEGIFVLDANVLLNLYRYTPETSKSIINVLDSVKERIWMSHQAALEYQDNRLQEINQQEKIYKQIEDKLDATYRDLELILSRGHLSINIDGVMKRISNTFESVKRELESHHQKHPDLFTNDSIRDHVTSLLSGKVGIAYDCNKLQEIYAIGEFRYRDNIPPGYKDISKDNKKKYGDLLIESKYGDLIQWFQIIDKAKESNKNIIFITDDAKEDWWWQSSGKTIGPRPELVTELKNKTGSDLYMYTPDNFIRHANEYLKIKITQKVINEVHDYEQSKYDWKNAVINALEKMNGEGHLSDIYECVKNDSLKTLPKTWQSQVRKALYCYSSDCGIYLGKEDIFLHVDKGVWALRKAIESK
jgi:hypothetical protein